MKKVLEIEVVKINEEYSAWYIKYQDTKILKRGKFRDLELGVISSYEPGYFTDEYSTLFIQGNEVSRDLNSFIIVNKIVPALLERVNKINELYGVVNC